jgi:hypothetical protein
MEARMATLKTLSGIGLICLAWAVAGCRQPTSEEEVKAEFTSHADLMLTLGSQDPSVQAELSRVQAEKGLPRQLQDIEDQIAGKEDLTAAFFDVFDSDWQLQSLQEALVKIWPAGNLDFGDTLPRARKLVEEHQERRRILRAGLRAPNTRFRLDFTQGFGGDLRWLTATEVLARMEAIEIDDAVSNHQLDQAIESLAIMFRLAQKLDEAPQLIPRLQAVEIRRLALKGIQRVATSVSANETTREQCLDLLEQQITLWADEAQAWKGDRAIGMHVYEMVRDGGYLSLLTEQELKELDARRERLDRAYVVLRNIDIDELYFLETMRLAIDMSNVPFYQRLSTWNERFEALDEWRGGHEFPRVAADIMFPAFTTAQQRIGRDRARCDAWRLALQQSLGRGVNQTIHSVTGEPFLFGDEVGVVRVLGLEEEDKDLEPVLLPAAKP